uniref:NADPH--hemoprotein reductase n=2 Tax=Lygus hesperus TaxID=30085 RepID=A0A0A9XHN9_LYGHE
MSTYSWKRFIDEKFCIVFCSTYGNGDVPTHVRPSVQFLEDQIEAGATYSGTHVAVFALGSTQYTHFCSAGKLFAKLFAALQCPQICPIGLGDDSGSIHSDFNVWLRGDLLPKLQLYFPKLDTSACGDVVHPYRSALDITFLSQQCESYTKYRQSLHRSCRFFSNPLREQRTDIFVVREVQELLHCDLVAAGESVKRIILGNDTRVVYRTADDIAIYPHNTDELVNAFVDILQVDPTTLFIAKSVSKNRIMSKFPVPCSVRDALTYYLDIETCTFAFLNLCLQLCQNSQHQSLLRELLHTNPHHVTVLQILQRCDLHVPLQSLLDTLQPMQPRLYTISSSPRRLPLTVQVTVKLHQRHTASASPSVATNYGLCSKQLCTSTVSDRFVGFVRRSHFKLPIHGDSPIIMVATGAGIAPFIGFLHDMYHRQRTTIACRQTI